MTNGNDKKKPVDPAIYRTNQRSIYLPREAVSNVERIAEYRRRKHGVESSLSDTVRFALEAVVAALDEEIPDFEYPKVNLGTRR